MYPADMSMVTVSSCAVRSGPSSKKKAASASRPLPLPAHTTRAVSWSTTVVM